MLDIYSCITDVPFGQNTEYWEKQIHDVPLSKEVNRESFIIDRCKDKRVLNLGSASGLLHTKIKEVAKQAIGVDKIEPADFIVDLDYNPHMCPTMGFDLIIAGEIIEHLTNPGYLLRKLKDYIVPMIVTLPNCVNMVMDYWNNEGKENVNRDHVAWYSYTTAKCLFEKCGWTVSEFYWYGGKSRIREGIIFVVV
jgi:hypothetical protein